MSEDIIKHNKISNEEFKIWKKSIPLLYNHITSVKPKLNSYESLHVNQDSEQKSIAFTDDIKAHEDEGTLSCRLLLSRGGDVYSITTQAPLGLYCNRTDSGELASPEYYDMLHDVEHCHVNPSWHWEHKEVSKIQSIKYSSAELRFIAQATDGSIAWFQENQRTPIYQKSNETLPEKSILHGMPLVDFQISKDCSRILGSQYNGPGGNSSVRLIDATAGRSGDVIDQIMLEGTIASQTVRFIDHDLAGICSDDGSMRLWDLRSKERPRVINFGHSLTTFNVSPFIDNLIVTGSENGVIRLWDLRCLSDMSEEHSSNGALKTNVITETSNEIEGDGSGEEVLQVQHFDNKPVVNIEFSPLKPEELLSVGSTGNVYHWDTKYFFESFDMEDDQTPSNQEELQSELLSFFHTGGSRRSLGSISKKNTVALHPLIHDLVSTVDADGLLTVYQPFTARIDEVQGDIGDGVLTKEQEERIEDDTLAVES